MSEYVAPYGACDSVGCGTTNIPLHTELENAQVPCFGPDMSKSNDCHRIRMNSYNRGAVYHGYKDFKVRHYLYLKAGMYFSRLV